MTDNAGKLTPQQIAEELLKPRSDPNAPKKDPEKPTIKKEAKPNQPEIKPQQYYDIRVETMLPATLTYRILAESPEQAVEMIKNIAPTNIKYKLAGKRDTKLSVYDAGTNMLRWMRNIIGGR